MTITVTDTNTGQALTVHAVAAELARQDDTELHIAQDAVIRPVLQLEHMVAEARAWHNIAHRCRKILSGHWHEEADPLPVPEFADLPPASPVANQVYDQEKGWVEADTEFPRGQALNQLVRRKQAEDKWAQQGRVPEVPPEPPLSPWQRVKRAAVAVLQRDAEERAL